MKHKIWLILPGLLSILGWLACSDAVAPVPGSPLPADADAGVIDSTNTDAGTP